MIPKKISNVLIIRTDRIGDVLMNLPMVHRIKANYPNVKITLLCQPILKELLQYHPLIDHFLTVTDEQIKKFSTRQKIFKSLKYNQFDCVIIPASSKWAHWLAFRLRAQYRVGFDRKWGWLLTHRITDRKDQGLKHEVDCNLQLIDKICSQPWNKQLTLGFNRHPKYQDILNRHHIAKDKKVIAFHVTTSNPEKQWSLQGFKQVMHNLMQENKYQILLVGAQDLDQVNAVLDFPNSENFTNLIGQTPLDELGVILHRADLLVSLDSGPYHMAWMQKTPVIGIFIKEAIGSNPTRWGVYPEFTKSFQMFQLRKDITAAGIEAAIKEIIA